MKRRNFFQTLLASVGVMAVAPVIMAEPVDDTIIWVTSRRVNGRTRIMMRITDMSDEHIINCIRCLKGKGKARIPDPYHGRSNQEWRKIFIKELERRRIILLDIHKICEKA